MIDCKPFALLLIAATGCGSSAGSVSGTVTYKGKPVSSGTVTIFSAGKSISGGIEDGAFAVKGVPLGEARVTVVQLDPNQANPYDSLKASRKQMMEKSGPGDKTPDFVAEAIKLPTQQKKRHLLPIEYSATETSELHLTVAAGANTFDIELKDRADQK